MIDTHSHIYDESFDPDRDAVISRAKSMGVSRLMLPAVDSKSHGRLFDTCQGYPEICCAMMGLHPTSVNDNPLYMNELEQVKNHLLNPPEGIKFWAIGEVGLDLHWSTDFLDQQIEAFIFQIELALRLDLPLVIHTRDAWSQTKEVLSHYSGLGLRGIMHSFSGTIDDYRAIKEIGNFCFGIAGPVTYKRSDLAATLPLMSINDIVLETDSPYLPPTPYRGKRNESSYLPFIRDKVAELMGTDNEQINRITTMNAERIFDGVGLIAEG